jgi:sulfatase modifying factor 1
MREAYISIYKRLSPCLCLFSLVFALAGCDSDGSTASERQGASLGQPCDHGQQCESGICIEVAEGRRVCSQVCEEDGQCPQAPNWSCDVPLQVEFSVCRCDSDSRLELCGDGLDNDCDGEADDCMVCDGVAVPMDHPRHCGSCDNACPAGTSCVDGQCLCPDGSPLEECAEPGGPECVGNEHCDDGIDCTDDQCVDGACQHRVAPERCPAGQVCDLRRGGCQPGRPCATDADCADNDLCTADEHCDPVTRACLWVPQDEDADGDPPRACGGTDCDDSQASVYLGAPELCDGLDNNCDGQVDQPLADDACPSDSTCQAGQCVCVSPLSDCAGECVDLMTDADNCRQCGNACGRNESCVDGACECVDGEYDCLGVCEGGAEVDANGDCCLAEEQDECEVCFGYNRDMDCKAVCFGDAVTDDCGVCDGNNQDKDCNGVCFGPAELDCAGVCEGTHVQGAKRGCCYSSELDDCGVCNGGNTDKDCAGVCFGDAVTDCLGVCDGSAVVDDCGVCNGNDAAKDCFGVCFGDAVVDDCGVCDGNNTDKDCLGICFGDAVVDDCGVCDGNNADKDCLGVCFGDAVTDCLGVCDGSAVVDDCGVCEGNNADKDCAGVCFGDAVTDDCGVCEGNNADKDCLGVCFGDAVFDCSGKECGPDGCGGSCPPGCSATEECGTDGICHDNGPSCAGMTYDCNDDGMAVSCCDTVLVPGGTFPMGRCETGPAEPGCDDYYPDGSSVETPEHDATVADFYLDIFEVTVGRFRRFVEQYNGTPPAQDAGAHPLIPGSGWQSDWDTNLPATRDDLIAELHCTPNATWTETVGAMEQHPINCVSWHEAFAFCIWDGGRLPTEAEWEYAAAGGDENRFYPWGSEDPGVTPLRACFDSTSSYSPVDVGSFPAGAGRWGQHDLAGNVTERLLDRISWGWYSGDGNPCDNCANLSFGSERIIRGGSYTRDSSALRAADRGGTPQIVRSTYWGLRCARNP